MCKTGKFISTVTRIKGVIKTQVDQNLFQKTYDRTVLELSKKRTRISNPS